MTEIPVTDARKQLPALVKLASAGEVFVITLSGLPLAQLGPLPKSKIALDEAGGEKLAGWAGRHPEQAKIDQILGGMNRKK